MSKHQTAMKFKLTVEGAVPFAPDDMQSTLDAVKEITRIKDEAARLCGNSEVTMKTKVGGILVDDDFELDDPNAGDLDRLTEGGPSDPIPAGVE